MEEIAVQDRPRTGWQLQGFVPAITGLIWLLLLFALGSAEMVRWSVEVWGRILLLLLSAAALYVVPGLALLELLWRDDRLPWTERLALACGISVALPPLVLEVAHGIGLPLASPATL